MRPPTVLVVLLLVLAGCSSGLPEAEPPNVADATTGNASVATTDPPSPPSDARSPSPTDSATVTERPESPESLADSYDVETEGGELPVDYPLVHARVVSMLDARSTEPPERVRIEPNSRMGVGASRYPEFYRLLGIRVPEDQNRTMTAAAYVRSPDTVTVNRRILDRSDQTERTLAHESVHVVQFRTDAFGRTSRGVIDGRPTTDDSVVQRSITEGSATYAETEYAERYDLEGPNATESMGERYRNGTGASKLGLAPYYFGARYADSRVEEPAEIDSLYDDPPRTSEELVHGLEPGSEPVADLTVEAESGGNWELEPTARDRFGELFVRIVLGTELNESAAAAGADGWGDDERLAFGNAAEGERGTGYAWVLRFDDAANATEFTEAFDEWEAVRDEDNPVRSDRVDDETVVVVLGSESFVESVEASSTGEDGTVTVQVDDEGYNRSGSPKVTASPTTATRAPVSTCPVVNGCMGEVTRSSSNSR